MMSPDLTKGGAFRGLDLQAVAEMGAEVWREVRAPLFNGEVTM